MKQYDIINGFISELKNKNLLKCAFLEGSYARKREDEYSNIDFHLVLLDDDFFDNYYKRLSKYGKIIYHKNIDNREIIIVFKKDINESDVNLKINIHISDIKDINTNNDVLVLYDKDKLLDNIDFSLSYTYQEIGKMIDDIALLSLDFIRMYKRGDIAIMFDIVKKIEYNYIAILRYSKDKASAKLNKKEILSIIDKDEKINYINILKKMKIDSLKEDVQLILDEVAKLLPYLDLNVASEFDYDFFNYIVNEVKNLR